MKKQILIFAGVLCFTCLKAQTKYNIAKDKVLYTIGYSHLDTEWNWDYPQVINEYIKSIMTENFPLFEKYPD
ncbi:MAG: alpha-mannosidase, partial [Bacteroidetes bacterium]|nr:alpha-mannosidase [Bacteroidota bacterium]